jgi:hypothetical protein
MLISLNFAWKGTVLTILKGSNSGKTYNFKIKNVQMVYWTHKKYVMLLKILVFIDNNPKPLQQ